RFWRNWRTGVGVRAAGHHRAVASRLAAPAMDPTFETPTGQPSTIDQQKIRVLVREMAAANPLWGATPDSGELRTLGVDVSERTVSRLLERHPRTPSQTWRRSSRITSPQPRRWISSACSKQATRISSKA